MHKKFIHILYFARKLFKKDFFLVFEDFLNYNFAISAVFLNMCARNMKNSSYLIRFIRLMYIQRLYIFFTFLLVVIIMVTYLLEPYCILDNIQCFKMKRHEIESWKWNNSLNVFLPC